MELAELEAGNGYKRKLVCARALGRWRVYAAATGAERRAVAVLEAAAAVRAAGEWRCAARALACARRSYLRRTLRGWYERVLAWQTRRARLLEAAQLLRFGLYARCFLAWLELQRERAAKQLIFAQKQAALQVRRWVHTHAHVLMVCVEGSIWGTPGGGGMLRRAAPRAGRTG
eukprot:364950-Chlamydomonas_euryale.AAC.25